MFYPGQTLDLGSRLEYEGCILNGLSKCKQWLDDI